MSDDLKSEIEARKARIAELRRQREAHSRDSPNSVYGKPSPVGSPQRPFSIVVPSVPLVEIPQPYLYQKITQSDSIIDEDSAESDADQAIAIEQAQAEADPEPALPEALFTVISEDEGHTPPDLVRFLDNAWRSVSRSESAFRGAPLRDFTSVSRTSPQRPLDQSASDSGFYQMTSFGAAIRLLEWSPFFDDLAVTGGKEETRAYIWSIDAPEHPEFTLRAPTAISALEFSGQSPSHLYGGGSNGQVFLWDLKDLRKGGSRYDYLPQLRSPADSAPIVALKYATASSSLVSLSSDGVLSIWSSDVLSVPQHRLALDDTLRSTLHSLKIPILVPTAMALFYPPEYGYGLGYGIGLCVVGTLTGHLLRIPSSKSAQSHPFAWAHNGPITSLSFRRLSSTNSEDGSRGTFLLSSGLDWRINLWYVPLDEAHAPVKSLSVTVDFNVRDLQWHPTLSTVFAAVGDSQAQVWDLAQSTIQPQLLLTSADSSEISVVRFGGGHSARVAVGGPLSPAIIYNFAEKQFGASGESWLTSLVYKLN